MMKSSAFRKFLCGVLSVIFVFQPLASAADLRPGSEEEAFIRLTEDFERACDLMEEALPGILRDTFDPRAVLEEAGPDPGALFDWVRRSTALVPYRGMLRSAEGVLMDRMGNSLDRALLLYRLVEMAGEEVRLVRGALADGELERLVSVLPPALPRARPESPEGEGFSDEILSQAEALAAERGLDGPSVRVALEKQASAAKSLREEARQRTESQTEELMRLLGDIPARTDEAAARVEKNEALRDHWWVQWKKDGAWTDLDPASVDGNPLAEVGGFFSPEEIPESLRHRVHIRVVAEVAEKGSAREETLLEHAAHPYEAWGRRITLVHSPTNWPGDAHPLSGQMTMEKLRAALLNQKEWVPMLLVGSKAHYQKGIGADGAINDNPSPGLPTTGKSLGSALGGFGAKLDSIGGGKSSAGDGNFTALWIEYKIASPGRDEELIRREIFDLSGPARRLGIRAPSEFRISEEDRLHRAAALLTATDITILPGRPSEAFLLHSYAKSLLDLREKVRAAAKVAEGGASEELLRDLELSFALPALPQPLWLAAVRDSWRREGAGLFTAMPLILAWHSGVRFDPELDNLAFEAFDIVSNPAEVYGEGEAFKERLAQGVLDTNAEAMIMREAFRVGESRGNAGEAFDKSLKEGVPWVLIKSPDDPLLSELPADAGARISAALAAGLVIAAPRPGGAGKYDDFAWWQIDAATGETLGIGPMGWGSEFVEYAILLSFPFVAAGTFIGCMGHPGGWTKASFVKIFGCVLLSSIASKALLIPLFLPGTAGVAVGIAGSLMTAGGGFFSAFVD
ncbi:MAG: hypothetical protein ACOYJV_10985 [Aminivibrio sp.]